MRHTRCWLATIVLLLATQSLAWSQAEHAEESEPVALELPARAGIFLIDEAGVELGIGSVEFSPSSGGRTGIAVEVGGEAFSDQFLSMRPFDCITDPQEWVCYLDYPYTLSNTISTQDLTDLEYQLLFVFKAPSEFGIDAWNGLYYKLTLRASGEIHGQLLQGDLNVLASPPGADERPIQLAEFIADGAAERRFPSLVIRPEP